MPASEEGSEGTGSEHGGNNEAGILLYAVSKNKSKALKKLLEAGKVTFSLFLFSVEK